MRLLKRLKVVFEATMYHISSVMNTFSVFLGPAMWIFILLFWVGQTFAQVPFLGGCPDIETMPDFNVTRVSFFE